MRLADRRRIEATLNRTGWSREVRERRGFEQIVARFQSPYEDEKRRALIEERLREWRKAVDR